MANWNEADHPRVPGGDINGGRFTEKEVGNAAVAAGIAAGTMSKSPLRARTPLTKDYVSKGKEAYDEIYRHGAFKSHDEVLPTGERVKVKPNVAPGWAQATDPSIKEALAYEIDRRLGLDIVPETFFNPDTNSSYQLFVEGGDIGEYACEDPDSITHMEDFGKMKLLDIITGNTDRHDQNWLVKDGHVVAIDNGMTFNSRSEEMGPEWHEFRYNDIFDVLTDNGYQPAFGGKEVPWSDGSRPPIRWETLSHLQEWYDEACPGVDEAFLAEHYQSFYERIGEVLQNPESYFEIIDDDLG